VGQASGRLVDQLVAHGVPERGARLYVAACRGGVQSASELARAAGLHRVEAYRFLRDLQREGLLRSVGRRPMRFAPLPPDELIDRWISGAHEHIERLTVDKARVLADLESSLAAPDEPDPRKFSILEGREQTFRFLTKKIGSAEREVLASVSGFALAPAIDGGVDRSLREAHERGVKVRLVSDITRANLAEAKHFDGFTELRHALSPVTNRAVVIDRRGALVFVSGEEGLGATGMEQVALWSTAPRFVALARGYHLRVWRHAEPSEKRFVKIESPPTAVLPVVRGREAEPFQRLREITTLGMQVTGIAELRLDLPEIIETVARQLGRQIAENLEGTTPADVGRELSQYYAKNALGQLQVVKERPLVLKVTQCFACTRQSPEIGRVMCSRLLRTVLERRVGGEWVVSEPDPRRHATRGCVFSALPA
jgi:sugar-specific transcriptional regulator TrmB